MPFSQESEKSVNPLKIDYYLNNFITLLDYVLERYQSLLSQQEKQFVFVLKSVSLPAARLYVRLILRTGPYFRQDKIQYKEVTNLDQAIDELKNNDLLQVNDNFPTVEVLYCLTRTELIALCKALQLPAGINKLKKKQLIDAIAKDPSQLIENYLKQYYVFLLPIQKEIVQVFRLLFFGNLYQDMSEFILEDIGVVRFEKYRIREQDRLFLSRQILDQTLLFININGDLQLAIEDHDSIEVMDILEKLSAVEVTHPNLIGRKQKSLLMGARYLERIKDWNNALNFYQQSNCPPSRERRVRILEKQNRNAEAFELLNQIKIEPKDDSEEEFVTIFSEKLNKKLNLPYAKRRRLNFVQIFCTLENKPEVKVEQVVLEHFQNQGWQGFFAENLLWNSLLGLYFWDIIFASSPGAFFNPYQRGPKDLFNLEFYHNRQAAINSRLNELHSDKGYREVILHNFEEKCFTANYLVAWKYLTLDHLQLVLEYVPAKHLALIFEAMIRHLGPNRSGFPDLFICKEGRYQLIEVKGPGDQLQVSQKRWLKRFEQWNVPYAVCKVKWL